MDRDKLENDYQAFECVDCKCDRPGMVFVHDVTNKRFGKAVDETGEFVEEGITKWICGSCWAKENFGGDVRATV